ncbi:protein phosphatase Slingshot homolog 3 isoform X2 [Brachyhypopomus gauderio]|uniref:protein phosphatase Slingshot homolog 3 isoform X2 n=1 Tax=Brachyhypopomus gauderio TaxID=698409 RepID=UPI004041E972
MALLTLHRSPSATTPDECVPRRGRLQKRESFALVKGAVLLLEEGARLGIHEEATPPPHPDVGGVESGTQHRHLHAMVSLLRPEDTIKLAVRLESVSSVRLRYLLIVTTASHKQESLLLGMDFPHVSSDHCTIGLVLPIWSDTQVYLDGDGGFSVTSAEVTRIFKPVSIQTMWSVLQALHGCCERAVCGAVIPGCGLDWAQHYQHHVESDQQCLNEWRAMTGLESVRKDSKGSSTEREAVEKEIKAQLRDIMRSEDLENITSKQVRSSLETRIGIDMKNYKEYIDNEMMVTMAQMDKPSKILDYLYLGSEWNAANFDELHKNNVGYILNVTMEIDNFYPESFTYMNVRVYDVEATDLLSHWNNTYMFINDARKRGQAVLVHCKMGVSRSASTVMAFLMKQQGWGLDHALNYVRERRPIVQPNDGFLRQLQTYSGILSASKQRHSDLWRRKSKSESQQTPATMPEQGAGSEGEDEEQEEEEDESPEEEESYEEEARDVFEDTVANSVPDTAGGVVPSPVITVQDSDKVTPSPSRSGRMDLFSLMQSIQLDDEDRLSDLENAATQRLSPAQRRRSHKRRALTHQKANVDCSPDPSSQSQNRNQDKAEPLTSQEETPQDEDGASG